MGNHQNKKVSRELYKNEYALRDGKKLIIRNAQLGDEQGLIDQMKIVDSETKFLAREPGEFNFSLEQEREFIKNTAKDENSLFLIGEIDSRIIANCSVGVISNNKRYLHRAAMGIAVCKDYWRNGIGKKMMQECIKWCKEKGIEQLELEVVTENNRAVSMYKSLGFQIYGTKKHALKYGNGTYADEYYMILFLHNINPA
ncbi:GNAT family N-acetyltransferase [Clostridium sediminicola]|uniref:GNAT family N-acetyltransferase n=1 Tax=Clostridium sediminicola TaxID=3114879 RepID=UPI0031F20D2E